MAASLSVLLVIVLGIAGVSSECLNGWTRFDNSCYRLFEKKLIWPEAQFECETHDAFLADVESKHETANIQAYLKELNIDSHVNIWIGLTDVRRESHYVWENTKKNATYFDWAHNEPNQTPEKNEDCVILFGREGHKWADAQCEIPYFYLCERSLHAAPIV